MRNHEGEEESGRARGTERKEENSKPKRTRESKERERDVERKTVWRLVCVCGVFSLNFSSHISRAAFLRLFGGADDKIRRVHVPRC